MKIRLAVALALMPVAVLSGCASTSQNQETAYSADEVMFAQMMIPHHSQAVEMSAFAEGRTDNAEILELASGIKNAQEPEIVQMKAWLTASGASLMGHHMMMDGMLSDSELADLEGSSGRDFEVLYLKGMIKHHQGALAMLSMLDGSTNDEVLTLKNNIETGQTSEIKQMEALLEKY